MNLLLLISTVALSAASPPNVVFLSIDTLRADYLGCYGYPADVSPEIDALAEHSLVFDDCICEVPLTNPSFASMHTSLYPRMAGATRNGMRVTEGVPLIAEQFKAAGYETMCVQSNWTLKNRLSGLARGFDIYEEDFHEKRWGFIKPERDAEDVTDVGLDLLEERDKNKPFFLWIHYTDPHAPYKYHRKNNPTDLALWRLRQTERVRLKYATEVAYTDVHVGRFLQALPKENTAILFVADHGESLYEHDYLGHGRRIYQDNLHIPLMIRGEGVAPGRTPFPARGIDVAPTLLGLAGLPPVPGMLGKNLLEAAKEAPSGATPESRPRVVETYGGAVPKIPGVKQLMSSSGPMRQGVIHDGWKLITKGKNPELFYLPEDPQELDNRASQEPGRVDELHRLIDGWDTRYVTGKADHADLSSDDRQALKSLGYLD